ncbi:MAG: N-acyl-D-amino-acid deacylase family protein [Gammaproteobacteria bacterium]
MRGFSALVRGGQIYDGLGGPPEEADVGLTGDRITAIGNLSRHHAHVEIDARGLAVAPGFINCLSWATESLLVDSSAESDVRQGVTLEVFGEGSSMGPLTPSMKQDLIARQGGLRFDIEWTTLGEYLELLERRGVVPNVASFVGATTVRIHELGYANRAPDAAELERMCALVRAAMREGALGVGSALIYAPGAYAGPAELLALASAAAESGGGYITHLRSETNGVLAAVDELLAIAAATRAHAEIYHLKVAGSANWHQLDDVLTRIEATRDEGLDVSANMYPYTAAATGFDAAMPPWVQEGGHEAWLARLRDPAIRARVVREIARPGEQWENLYTAAGSPEHLVLTGFRSDALRRYRGMTLGQVARERSRSPEETIVDLVLEDDSRVIVAYFLMSEDNVRRQLALPWVSLCSDEEALAPRGVFLAQHPHPRAYGSFARFLGRYVRDEKVITLPEAIRRLTSLPARNFRLRDRGRIAPGCCGDVVVFDPRAVADHATYDEPQRFASGVAHVLVNGQIVLRDGEMTGARPGRFVRGPGRVPARQSAPILPKAAG